MPMLFTIVVAMVLLTAGCAPAAAPSPTAAPPKAAAKPAALGAAKPAASPAAKPAASPAPLKVAAPLEQLVQKAKGEGQVTMKTNIQPDEIKGALEAFEKQYGVKVTYDRITGVETYQRLLAEHLAGRDLGIDAIYPGDEFINEFMGAKAFVAPPFEYKALWPSLPDDQLTPDRWGVALAGIANSISYNRQLVGDAVPKTWDDCADPRWQGKIVVDTRLSLYAFAYHDPDWFYPWMTRLKNNGARLTRGLTEPLQNLLVPGEAALHCTMEIQVGVRAEKDSPDVLGNVLPDPYSVRGSSWTFVYARARSPNAAQLLTGFMATEGHKLMDSGAPGRGFPWVQGTWLNQNASRVKFKMCDQKCVGDAARLQTRYQEALGLPT